MLQTTLGIVLRGNQICLGRKKTGFGKGVLNGPGGKCHTGESPEDCMIREIKEEFFLDITRENIQKVGIIDFKIQSEPHNNCIMHLYKITDITSEPKESQEMTPAWFSIDSIPYNEMWEDDKYWLPRILAGESDIEYKTLFDSFEAGMKEIICVK